MATSTLTSKGQVTIPKAVRDRMGLQPGDVLDFRFEGDGRVLVSRLGEPPAARAFGILRHLAGERPATVEEMRQAILRRARELHR